MFRGDIQVISARRATSHQWCMWAGALTASCWHPPTATASSSSGAASAPHLSPDAAGTAHLSAALCGLTLLLYCHCLVPRASRTRHLTWPALRTLLLCNVAGHCCFNALVWWCLPQCCHIPFVHSACSLHMSPVAHACFLCDANFSLLQYILSLLSCLPPMFCRITVDALLYICHENN